MDGKLIKKQILEELKNKVSEMEEKPSLVVIQIGDNDASNVYIKQKAKMADYIGYGYRHIKLDENVSEEEVLKIIDELNQDKKVNGVMVQMPLPRHISTDKVQNAVIPSKDVDGFSFSNSLYATLPTSVLGNLSLNSYSYGHEYLAKLVSQWRLIFFLTLILTFIPSFNTIYALATCFLYGWGIPITTQLSTSGICLIIFST